MRVPVDSSGKYEITNLLPGKYVVRGYNGATYSTYQSVDLKEGESLNVAFNFPGLMEDTVIAYPNPVKLGNVTIQFKTGHTDIEAEIKIFNIAAELVKEVKSDRILLNTGKQNYTYEYNWDCTNDSNNRVASGVYLYIVQVRDTKINETRKVVKKLAIIW